MENFENWECYAIHSKLYQILNFRTIFEPVPINSQIIPKNSSTVFSLHIGPPVCTVTFFHVRDISSTLQNVDCDIFRHYSMIENVESRRIVSNNVEYCRIFKKCQIMSRNVGYYRTMLNIVE